MRIDFPWMGNRFSIAILLVAFLVQFNSPINFGSRTFHSRSGCFDCCSRAVELVRNRAVKSRRCQKQKFSSNSKKLFFPLSTFCTYLPSFAYYILILVILKQNFHFSSVKAFVVIALVKKMRIGFYWKSPELLKIEERNENKKVELLKGLQYVLVNM